jgi:hypothetical protein
LNRKNRSSCWISILRLQNSVSSNGNKFLIGERPDSKIGRFCSLRKNVLINDLAFCRDSKKANDLKNYKRDKFHYDSLIVRN